MFDAIQISKKTLDTIVATQVDRAMAIVVHKYFDQSSIITEITKAQAAKLLGYKTTHSLKKIERNGIKINGTYHALKPNDKGMYSYVEVIRIRNLKNKHG